MKWNQTLAAVTHWFFHSSSLLFCRSCAGLLYAQCPSWLQGLHQRGWRHFVLSLSGCWTRADPAPRHKVEAGLMSALSAPADMVCSGFICWECETVTTRQELCDLWWSREVWGKCATEPETGIWVISYKLIYCSFLVDYRTKHQDSKAVKVVSLNMWH